MKILSHELYSPAPHTLQVANDIDPQALSLEGIDRIELVFPKFTDGRAFSQAYLLRRRCGFEGELVATGDVLPDQLALMQRAGFDLAVLRADQQVASAQQVLARDPALSAGSYQGDAREPAPHFSRAGI